jgi:hypothetical protein
MDNQYQIDNIIISYPRSGNHLTRFMIELLSEKPTFGCEGNPRDIPIYENTFNNYIPFNITSTTKDSNNNDIAIDKSKCYHKFHYTISEKKYKNAKNLIFLLRNPQEVLLRNSNYQIQKTLFDKYFTCIDYYLDFKGNKILFYYEDMLTNKSEFITQLYQFLNLQNTEKLNWVLDNIDFLYQESKEGKNRDWGGVNSNSTNYYYPKLNDKKNKNSFYEYLFTKLREQKYSFIDTKYEILINYKSDES